MGFSSPSAEFLPALVSSIKGSRRTQPLVNRVSAANQGKHLRKRTKNNKLTVDRVGYIAAVHLAIVDIKLAQYSEVYNIPSGINKFKSKFSGIYYVLSVNNVKYTGFSLLQAQKQMN